MEVPSSAVNDKLQDETDDRRETRCCMNLRLGAFVDLFEIAALAV